MTLNRLVFRIPLLAALLLLTQPAFALMEIANVSRDQARKLGVSVRTYPNGEAGVQVRLTFPTRGRLKDFVRVELQIGEGDTRVMSADLVPTRPDADTVTARFSAFPTWLGASTLTIVVGGESPRGGLGYRLRVRDFLEPVDPH